jgi:hypothetical protein
MAPVRFREITQSRRGGTRQRVTTQYEALCHSVPVILECFDAQSVLIYCRFMTWHVFVFIVYFAECPLLLDFQIPHSFFIVGTVLTNFKSPTYVLYPELPSACLFCLKVSCLSQQPNHVPWRNLSFPLISNKMPLFPTTEVLSTPI